MKKSICLIVSVGLLLASLVQAHPSARPPVVENQALSRGNLNRLLTLQDKVLKKYEKVIAIIGRVFNINTTNNPSAYQTLKDLLPRTTALAAERWMEKTGLDIAAFVLALQDDTIVGYPTPAIVGGWPVYEAAKKLFEGVAAKAPAIGWFLTGCLGMDNIMENLLADELTKGPSPISPEEANTISEELANEAWVATGQYLDSFGTNTAFYESLAEGLNYVERVWEAKDANHNYQGRRVTEVRRGDADFPIYNQDANPPRDMSGGGPSVWSSIRRGGGRTETITITGGEVGCVDELGRHIPCPTWCVDRRGNRVPCP